MATWQTSFNLVPTGTQIGDDFDVSDALVRADVPVEELDSVAPRGQSWSASIDMWGQQDGDLAEALRNSGELREIAVRFDLRDFNKDFATGVLAFAERHNLVLYSPEARCLIKPTTEALGAALRRSSAWRYVSDPEGFLRTIVGG